MFGTRILVNDFAIALFWNSNDNLIRFSSVKLKSFCPMLIWSTIFLVLSYRNHKTFPFHVLNQIWPNRRIFPNNYDEIFGRSSFQIHNHLYFSLHCLLFELKEVPH